jgi:hypothetical protein
VEVATSVADNEHCWIFSSTFYERVALPSALAYCLNEMDITAP